MLLLGAMLVPAVSHSEAGQAAPEKGVPYRTIVRGEPNLFVDDYFVDNRFNEEFISARVPHVLHRGERRAQPLLTKDDDKPWEVRGVGYPSVLYDPDADLFRLYYQIHNSRDKEDAYLPGYCSCHAQSKDGVTWEKPLFDLVPWGPEKMTNIVLRGPNEGKVMHVHHVQGDAVRPGGERVRNIGTLPPDDFDGHRFLAFYCDHEHYLAVSDDGVRWQQRRQMILPNRVDCFQTICHDAFIGEYVIFYLSLIHI